MNNLLINIFEKLLKNRRKALDKNDDVWYNVYARLREVSEPLTCRKEESMNTNEIINIAPKFSRGQYGTIVYRNNNYKTIDGADLSTVTTCTAVRLNLDYENTKTYDACESHRGQYEADSAILAKSLFHNDNTGKERLLCYCTTQSMNTKYFVNGEEVSHDSFKAHVKPVNHRAGWTPKPVPTVQVREIFPENIIELIPPKSQE